ncbi:TPR-like protein [Acephala macrosclerotiorum]|nr:TPR-like protein [Acephala macrosclerotiorum]
MELLKEVNNTGLALVETGDLTKLNLAIDMTMQAIAHARSVKLYPTTMVVNLTNMLSKRYHHTQSGADVELGIRNGNTALRLMGPDDPQRRYLYGNLGMLYHMRYDYQKTTDDLEKSIEHTTAALSMSPQGDPVQHDLQFNLGKALHSRYKKTQDAADLDRSIEASENALRLAPTGNPLHAYRMAILSESLRTKFERTQEINIVNRSISVMEEALCIIPRNGQDRPRMLIELGISFGRRFECTDKIADLEEAIRLSEEAKRLAGVGHESHATILSELARWLCRRSEAKQSRADLERAILIADEALLLTPDDPGVLNNLANFLRRRFDLSMVSDDLDRSIRLFERAREASTLDDPGYLTVLYSLAIGLGSRFELLGNIEDLELAIATNKEALELTPKDHPDRFRTMINQAAYLELEFKHSGHKGRSSFTEGLEEAVRLSERVLQEAPLDHPNRALWLEIHGNILGSQFGAHGDAKILDKAIFSIDKALGIVSRKGYTAPSTLSNYGEWLGQRFVLNGDIHDLNKAIISTDQAVKATSTDDRRKTLWQSNLGRWLHRRFELVGALEDLNHAIKVTEIAVDSTPKGDIELPSRRNNLSHYYAQRYERGNCLDDINKSIDILRVAIDETPLDHPRRSLWILHLAVRLTDRGITGSDGNHKDDLDNAVRHFDEALPLLPENAHNLVVPWTNFGGTLRHRFVLFGRNSKSTDDIDRSIKILTKARSAMDTEHRFRAATLLNLGMSYLSRSELTENPLPTDQGEAIRSFIECFRSPKSAPSYRIQGARQAAVILDSLSRSHEAAKILEEAIDLFPTLSPRSLSRSDQQHILSQITGIASMAAAMALKSGYGYYAALMLLERGRGIIASLLMETRMDMSALDSKLAVEFLEAREKLDAPQLATNITSPYLDDEASRSRYVSESLSRHEAEEQLQATIKKIQADSKTQDFLHPPSQDELIKVLDSDTIVVVNATSYRCDAFVINKLQGVSLVELTRLKLEDVNTRVERLRLSRPHIDPTMLEWLWDDIASPILEKLGFSQPSPAESLTRIFWILTGPLSRLPIHASGRHSKGSTETVMDRVMSSYCSSLRSFIHGKKAKLRGMRIPQEVSSKKALLVGMGKSPGGSGLPDLPFAVKEVESLEELCLLLNLEPVRLSSQTREAVLAELGAFFFHFAGHGQPDPLDPSQSGLLLEDGLLTVADIQAHKLGEQIPFLGYLSSCLTGANDADRLVDEGIHLISAFQLAGFRHVIGALWQVYDDSCVKVAEPVYKSIAESGITDRSVCAALHSAVMSLRDVWVAERSSATGDCTSPSTAKSAESVDSKALGKSADQEKDKERDGRLQLGKATGAPVAALVRADWVPYVHYGP